MKRLLILMISSLIAISSYGQTIYYFNHTKAQVLKTLRADEDFPELGDGHLNTGEYYYVAYSKYAFAVQYIFNSKGLCTNIAVLYTKQVDYQDHLDATIGNSNFKEISFNTFYKSSLGTTRKFRGKKNGVWTVMVSI